MNVAESMWQKIVSTCSFVKERGGLPLSLRNSNLALFSFFYIIPNAMAQQEVFAYEVHFFKTVLW